MNSINQENSSSTIKDTLIATDQYLDYVPGISTLTSIVNLCVKYAVPDNKEDTYITHLKNKDDLRSVALLIPVLGNLKVIYDDSLKMQLKNRFTSSRKLTFMSTEAFYDIEFAYFKSLLHQGLLTNVESVRVFGKRFLPDEFKLLINLRGLLLSDKLSSLPTEIGLLINLESLSLHNNKFTVFPREIGVLANLSSLDLSYNPLSTLSSEIGLLTNLSSLNISNTHITSLPSEIGLLTKLSSLNVTDSRITSLPSSMNSLVNLLKIKNSSTLEGLPSFMEIEFTFSDTFMRMASKTLAPQNACGGGVLCLLIV